MPLSKIQIDVLREIASHRDPESYVAGSTPLNRDAVRYSGDIDIFHDREERVAAAALTDVEALRAAGYRVSWLRQLPLIYTAEVSRGDARHGSCGQGIGEARSYWLKFGADSVFAADLRDLDRLRHKLELQRQRTILELQDFIGRIDADALHEFGLWDLNAEAVAGDLHRALPDGLAIDACIPTFRTAIFEGAQGALLDEYRGFHPFLSRPGTRSRRTMPGS